MSWDKFFIEQAKLVSTKSKDPSTKVGAIIVGPDNEVRSQGFNGFPRGVDDDVEYEAIGSGIRLVAERYDRPAKYLFTEHAERNAIYNAARVGIPLKDCTLYLNFEPRSCCCDCARAIIQSGIKQVVGPNIPFPSKGKDWEEHFKITEVMFYESDIEMRIADTRD
jgi:dCMP deaminase